MEWPPDNNFVTFPIYNALPVKSIGDTKKPHYGMTQSDDKCVLIIDTTYNSHIEWNAVGPLVTLLTNKNIEI